MIARTASGSVTSQVWYVASIPEECKSARVRAISDALWSKGNASEDECSGLRFCGIDAWIEWGPAQKDQAGHERHKAAGQVGADPGCTPGHDYNVSGAQVQT